MHIRAKPGRGLRGDEAPTLAESKVKKQDKISDSFDLFLCLNVLKLRDLANLWSLLAMTQ